MQYFQGSFEIEKEKIPDALYRIADFITQERSWFGSASQLQEAISDDSIPANQIAKQITRHYYEVFYPECIRFEKPARTNKVRGIRLYVDENMLAEKIAAEAAEQADTLQVSDDSDGRDGTPP